MYQDSLTEQSFPTVVFINNSFLVYYKVVSSQVFDPVSLLKIDTGKTKLLPKQKQRSSDYNSHKGSVTSSSFLNGIICSLLFQLCLTVRSSLLLSNVLEKISATETFVQIIKNSNKMTRRSSHIP